LPIQEGIEEIELLSKFKVLRLVRFEISVEREVIHWFDEYKPDSQLRLKKILGNVDHHCQLIIFTILHQSSFDAGIETLFQSSFKANIFHHETKVFKLVISASERSTHFFMLSLAASSEDHVEPVPTYAPMNESTL
jgi:hypothetical protein